MNLPESIHDFIFSFVESSITPGSLGVVFAEGIVHSAFSPSIVFACISLSYLLLNADFPAAAQILIYVGAVNILIVFAVMLTNTKKGSDLSPPRTTGDIITFTLCTSFFCLSINTISNTLWSEIGSIHRSNQIPREVLTDSIRRIGSELINEFLFPSEFMSIVLLVSLIGAITMARREEVT